MHGDIRRQRVVFASAFAITGILAGILVQGPQRTIIACAYGIMSGEAQIVCASVMIVQILILTNGEVHVRVTRSEFAYCPRRLGLAVKTDVGICIVGIDVLA